AQVIRAAMQPNVSIAAVALHYRLNANMLRSWVAAQEELDAAELARKSMSVPSAEFVPLQLEASGAASGATEILIEVRRGAATVT
ncbi:IS66 family insertion sequence element accessory protein TnpB, partial [Paraburkholderia sp. EG286B]